MPCKSMLLDKLNRLREEITSTPPPSDIAGQLLQRYSLDHLTRIETILRTKPNPVASLLVSFDVRWKEIQDNSLSYTANPDAPITLFLCELAEWVAEQHNTALTADRRALAEASWERGPEEAEDSGERTSLLRRNTRGRRDSGSGEGLSLRDIKLADHMDAEEASVSARKRRSPTEASVRLGPLSTLDVMMPGVKVSTRLREAGDIRARASRSVQEILATHQFCPMTKKLLPAHDGPQKLPLSLERMEQYHVAFNLSTLKDHREILGLHILELDAFLRFPIGQAHLLRLIPTPADFTRVANELSSDKLALLFKHAQLAIAEQYGFGRAGHFTDFLASTKPDRLRIVLQATTDHSLKRSLILPLISTLNSVILPMRFSLAQRTALIETITWHVKATDWTLACFTSFVTFLRGTLPLCRQEEALLSLFSALESELPRLLPRPEQVNSTLTQLKQHPKAYSYLLTKTVETLLPPVRNASDLYHLLNADLTPKTRLLLIQKLHVQKSDVIQSVMADKTHCRRFMAAILGLSVAEDERALTSGAGPLTELPELVRQCQLTLMLWANSSPDHDLSSLISQLPTIAESYDKRPMYHESSSGRMDYTPVNTILRELRKEHSVEAAKALLVTELRLLIARNQQLIDAAAHRWFGHPRTAGWRAQIAAANELLSALTNGTEGLSAPTRSALAAGELHTVVHTWEEAIARCPIERVLVSEPVRAVVP